MRLIRFGVVMAILVAVTVIFTGCGANKTAFNNDKIGVQASKTAEDGQKYIVDVTFNNETGVEYNVSGVFARFALAKKADDQEIEQLPVMVEAWPFGPQEGTKRTYRAEIPKLIFTIPNIDKNNVGIEVRGNFEKQVPNGLTNYRYSTNISLDGK